MSDETDAAISVKQRIIGRPFQPGQSGNPNGRPGGYAEFRALCREHSPGAVRALVEEVETGEGPSRIAAARVLLEYGWGKPSAAPEDLEAVQAGAGAALALLTRDEMLAIARDEKP